MPRQSLSGIEKLEQKWYTMEMSETKRHSFPLPKAGMNKIMQLSVAVDEVTKQRGVFH